MSTSKNIYILDPGHGGINPATGKYVTAGKKSPVWPDGSIFYEGVGNREIAARTGALLKAAGIDFCYTVTPSDWQDVSLTERCKRADLVQKKKPAVLISIHSNAGPNGDRKAHGFEVFTSPGQTGSDQIASIFFNEMKTAFPELTGRPMMGDGDPDKEEKFTMICRPKCRAILIESMFYTNQVECKMLMDPKVQDRIAQVILKTIKKVELL